MLYYKCLYIIKFDNIDNDKLITICFFYDNDELLQKIATNNQFVMLTIDNYDSTLFYIKQNLEKYRKKYFCINEDCEFENNINILKSKFGFGSMVVDKKCWIKIQELEKYYNRYYMIGQSKIEEIFKESSDCCRIC